MRKSMALILFTAFLAVQHAKQLSYWECKMSNSFRTGAEKCDCEKLVKDTKGATGEYPMPLRHVHIHPDEFYDIYEILPGTIDTRSGIIYYPTGHSRPREGITPGLDRPPQAG